MFNVCLSGYGVRVIDIAMGALVLASVSVSATGQERKEIDADYLTSSAGGPKLEQVVSAIIRSTNELRKVQGREPVKVNSKLTRAAQYFAAFMARTNKFGHEVDGNRPADRLSAFGYDYCIVAENIAYQAKSPEFKTEELSAAIFDSWKKSPQHLENMLDPDVAEIGVGIGHDPRSDRYYAVQEFGRPAAAAIHFDITNNASETIRYLVTGSAREQVPAKSFELPPGATMHHSRCRSSKLDWGWTKADDSLSAKSGRVYVISKSARGYEVSEKAAN
jgi:uncharacterized protein YkwD